MLEFVAQLIVVSGLAASRPALTLLAIQGAVLAQFYVGSNPVATDHWLVSPGAIAAGLALAVVELLIEHEADAEELYRTLHLDKILRAVCVVATSHLLTAAKLPNDLAANGRTLASAGEAGDLAGQLGGTAQPWWLVLSIAGGALTLNLLLTWVRGRLLERIGDIGLVGLWQKLETGGVVALLAVLALAPVLVLGLFLVLTLLLVAATLLGHAWEQALDRRRRRACPHCAAPIRVEALLCRQCRGDVEPEVWMGG